MMNGNHYQHHQSYSERFLDGFSNDLLLSPTNGYASIHVASSSSSSATALNSSPSSSSLCSRLGYIEHRVSKMDTVAGVAIKYRVEVADIRRMNGWVTDLQMFALETLRIPLPGRHLPSPIVSNGSTTNGPGLLEQINTRRDRSDYLWYTISINLDEELSPNEQKEVFLHIQSLGHAALLFINKEHADFVFQTQVARRRSTILIAGTLHRTLQIIPSSTLGDLSSCYQHQLHLYFASSMWHPFVVVIYF